MCRNMDFLHMPCCFMAGVSRRESWPSTCRHMDMCTTLYSLDRDIHKYLFKVVFCKLSTRKLHEWFGLFSPSYRLLSSASFFAGRHDCVTTTYRRFVESRLEPYPFYLHGVTTLCIRKETTTVTSLYMCVHIHNCHLSRFGLKLNLVFRDTSFDLTIRMLCCMWASRERG